MTQHNTEKLVKELPEKIRILQKVIDDLIKDFIRIDIVKIKKEDTDMLIALSASVGMFQSTLGMYNSYLNTIMQTILLKNNSTLKGEVK